MSKVTGEEVREAALAAGITRIEHHNCGLCRAPVFYSIHEGALFFNPGCDCSWSPPEPRSWESAAEWINMQSREDAREMIKQRFGFKAEPVVQ